MRSLQDVASIAITPASVSSDIYAQAVQAAFTAEFRKLLSRFSVLHLYTELDQQPEQIVDTLAWQFHVDFYEPNAPLDVKRELVKNSIRWHMFKGTKSAVEGLLSTFFVPAATREWFEYGGDPYRFRIALFGPTPSPEWYEQLKAALWEVKRETAWLDGFDVNQEAEDTTYIANHQEHWMHSEILPSRHPTEATDSFIVSTYMDRELRSEIFPNPDRR